MASIDPIPRPAAEEPAAEEPAAEPVPAADVPEGPSEVDLVFCMDCTSSMSSYIQSGQRSMITIAEQITAAEKADVRFAYIAYRDHPPQDSSFITKVNDFTSSTSRMRDFVNEFGAEGGGDGPEAVTAALNDALNLTYRKDAAKIVVIIADAPPHGLGEGGDGFPNGDPNGLDPIQIARAMAEKGIIIYTVACEPALSGYKFAHDFFEGICDLTEGKFLPLTSAHLLPDVIIGGAREEVAMQRLQAQIDADMAELERTNPTMTEDAMAGVISERMADRGVVSHKVEVDDIYGGYDRANIDMIQTTSSLAEVRSKLQNLAQPAPTTSFGSGPVMEESEMMYGSADLALGGGPPPAPGGGGMFSGIASYFSSAPAPSAASAPSAMSGGFGSAPAVQQVYSTSSSGMEHAHVAKAMRRNKKKAGTYVHSSRS